MIVKLYTSLSGFKNRFDGKEMYAFTKDSTMRDEVDDIVIYIDFEDIKFMDDDGIFTIKAKQEI